jgi:hypothetical protein
VHRERVQVSAALERPSDSATRRNTSGFEAFDARRSDIVSLGLGFLRVEERRGRS